MKKFLDIYTEIIKERKKGLEELRKRGIRARILPLVICGIAIVSIIIDEISRPDNVYVDNDEYLFAVFMVIIFIGSSILCKEIFKYQKFYKDWIVKRFLKEYDESLNFTIYPGISKNIYSFAEFEKFERFYSEDKIEGMIDNHFFQMSEVKIVKTVDVGKSFHGLVAWIKLKKNYDSEIRILSNKLKLLEFDYEFERIEMESSTFEELFDVFTDNKIEAFKLLTPEVIDKMISFYEKLNIEYEIVIKGNKLFIRFHTGPMFEGNIIKESTDFDTLKKLYDLLNFLFDISKEIIKIIEESR